MGTVTKFSCCSMTQVGTFNMCLENSNDITKKKSKTVKVEALINLANGIDSVDGEEINK